MERDLGVGFAIVAAATVFAIMLLLIAGPDWVLDVPVVVLMVLVITGGVTYFVAVYRRRLII